MPSTSPVTASSPDSQDSSDNSSSSGSSPPPSSPPPSSPPPPSQKSAPPPSDDSSSSSPPPKVSSPPSSPPPKSPPPSDNSTSSAPPPPPPTPSPPPSSKSPPPPSSSDDDSSSPPPPPSKSNSSPSYKFVSPPPPPRSSSTTPSSSSGALSPPPPPPHANSSPSDSSLNSKLPIIVGVSLGFGFLLAMFVLCCVCAAKKRKRQREPMYFEPNKGAGGEYYNGSQHPSWHNSQTSDHVVKLNQAQGGSMGGPPSHGGWPQAPPPPPPPHMINSGEVSSQYSGPRGPPLPPPSPNIALGFNKSTFTYDELAAATGGFSQGNLLGQGGFGYVHKGVLPNGKEIAVKSLKSGSGQGEREFQAEVEIISRVHHRHLVSLVGYCIAGGQRMLVYEFVPNKTLEYHLHGSGRPIMDFATRLRIALGSAKGLAYLHEDCHPRIIHRDIKAANILLDFNFEAMVADFGLAKLSSDNYTHVSTRVMGTFGYLAPEYAASGKLTEKSDVFSYGIMLLELVTGKRPVDNTNTMEDSLVDWARPLVSRALDDGNYEELADPRLENNFNPLEMARLVACAGASIRHSARRRPKMSQIVRALEGDVSLEDLNEGVRPGQSSIFGSSNGSSDYDASSYGADMKKFKKIALSSQEFSGEYGTTGEFGAKSSSSGEMNHSGNQKPPRTPQL